MKESSAVMLGFVAYLITGLIVLSNVAIGNSSIQSTKEGPLIVDIGAPHQANVLSDYFQSHGLDWPLQQSTIPAILVRALPRDMAEIVSTKERKSLFIRTLLPLVLLENHYLAEQRSKLQQIITQEISLSEEQHYWLEKKLAFYRLKGEVTDEQLQQKLLHRLDLLPPSLMLAQGAIESGWGTSRFAQQGNSLFGQWSYKKGSGLVPDARNEGASHMVAAFDNLQDSVRSYMRNLNTHAAYRELRMMRLEMREAKQALDAQKLALGLIRYSQRGDDYVKDVQGMIRSNKFSQYDLIELTQAGLPPTAG